MESVILALISQRELYVTLELLLTSLALPDLLSLFLLFLEILRTSDEIRCDKSRRNLGSVIYRLNLDVSDSKVL